MAVDSSNHAEQADNMRPLTDGDKREFAELVDGSLPAVRTMAQSWRTGLTGFLTLVTTGLVLTGRSTITSVAAPWRVAISAVLISGLLAGIAGLWQALSAEVGARARIATLDEIRKHYASVQAYRVGLAVAAGRRLRGARLLVALSLGLFLVGLVLTWWAPGVPRDPAGFLVVSHGGRIDCGSLLSADNGEIRLVVEGRRDAIVIPLVSVTNLSIKPSCPAS